MTNASFLQLLTDLYGGDVWPKPLHLLQGAELRRDGLELTQAARTVRGTAKRVHQVATATDPVQEALGLGLDDVEQKKLDRARNMLGQLVLGESAELAFEEIFEAEMADQEFELRDVRESRSDTDYRLLDGQDRPVYRINIKFHGARFRRAPELVGLQPDDCFALATYKIHSALQKQEQEGLPYLFAVVGVPHLSGAVVGESLPPDLVRSAALIHQAPKAQGKRDFEDRLVQYVAQEKLPIYLETCDSIGAAEWYVLSARKAHDLLKTRLFERVYGLRVRGFARAFRGAELDMHFSVAEDLTPLREYLATLRHAGPTKVTTLLERGVY